MKALQIVLKNRSSWYGNHSTEQILELRYYKDHKKMCTGLLEHTEYFDVDKIITDFVVGRGRVGKKGFEWLECERSKNEGSYSKFVAYPSKKHLQKLIDIHKENGWAVYYLEDLVPTDLVQEKFNKYLFR